MRQPDLLNDKVSGLYFKYLFPSISATLVTSIYILADTIMVGRGSGALGIAALNILLPLFNLFFGTGMMCGVGGSVLFSVYRGRGKEESARAFFTAAVLMTGFFSAFFLVFFHLFFEPVTRALGSSPALKENVRTYGRILVSGAPAFLFSSCLQAFVRNDRSPKLAMAGVIAGGVLNVVLDYIFIFPMKMGMAGAAVATVIASFVTVLILLTHFLSPLNTLRVTRSVTIRQMGKILENGFSSFLMELTGGIVIFLFNIQLLKYVGELGVVVYGIISNCALVAASISNGVAQAVQPILAVNFGAKMAERVNDIKKLGIVTAAALGFIFLASGYLKPAWLIAAFVEPAREVLKLGVPAIRIYFLSFLAAGINVLFITYFQSTLRPGSALALSLLRGVALNGIFVMALPMVLGVNGIWITIVLTEGITFLTALFMMRREKSIKLE